MKWWQIILCALTTIPFAIMFVIGVIIEPIKDNKEYRKKYNKWNETHPNLQRRLCKTCKYSKSETVFDGLYRYPNRFPHRMVSYCTLLHREIGGKTNCRCIIAEPTDYFCEPKDKEEPFPKSGVEVYYSAYGNCYHSTPNCRSIKNSRHIYTSKIHISERYPCPKCWIEKDGVLYPKDDK